MKEIYKATTAKKNININKIVDNIVKGIAFLAIIVSSAYGFRMALYHLNQNIAYGITALIMLCLVYIITRS